MPITRQKEWDHCVEINNDPYGKACVDIAREVMAILDEEPGDFDANELIGRGEDRANQGGITGFMAGCIAQMVSQCHSRGDEFRKSWNAVYNVTEEQSNGGVVNPAILTIEVKGE